MKPVTSYLVFLLCVLLVSCEKESTTISSPLLGKWKLYDTYYSAGGPLIYNVQDPASPIYLQFDEHGGLSMTNSDFKAYRLKDSSRVVFIKSNKTELLYFFNISEGILNLSPGGPYICIEGCGTRYVRVED